MRKILLLLVFPIFSNALFGQQKEEAEKLVDEGIAYHDKGDFEGAIARYDKALQLDKDNLLALTEKAMTSLALQKYDAAIQCCQKAIEKHPGDKGLGTVYVTYGNAYDELLKTDKALEVYEEGIKQFPEYYQLYFNKGITLSSVKKYDDALANFQKSASLNPKHASSHNAIARILDAQEKKIPSLLAYSRFLILEPESNRAKENLARLRKIMRGNVEQTGEKSVTININPDMLGDSKSNGKAKENNFASADLILTLSAGLDFDEKNKKKTEVERFISKFETVCELLKETQKDNYGFYWEYYVPYFIEMKDKNLINSFTYIAFATSEDSEVSKWLESHKSAIDEFYDWSKNYTWKAN
jgi:Flp pilus assembly protein TadD